MRKLTTALLEGLLLISISLIAECKTRQPLSSVYYVATDGSDSYSGTLPSPNQSKTDGPFLTLERAQQAVRAAKGNVLGPISVEIRGGTYYLSGLLSFTRADSGTAQQPITWEGLPGDPQPLISGGQRLTGWKRVGRETWTLQLPASFQNFEALYVNGERLFRPMTSSTYLTLNPVILSEPEPPNCTTQYLTGYRCSDRFSFRAGDLPSTPHDINDVEVVSFENWTVSRMRLQSIDPVQNIAYLSGGVSTGQYFGFMPGHRYLAQNVAENFGLPGQWYLDRAATPWELKLQTRGPADNPNTAVVIAPQQLQLLIAHNLQYVTFKHLAFSHDNYTIPAQGHPGTSGETTTPAALSFSQCSEVALNGVTIAHTQGWGIEFTGTALPGVGNTITSSLLYDLGTGGVRVGQLPARNDSDLNVAQYNTVSNDVIFGAGRFLPGGEGTGVWIGSSHHNVISHNDMHDFYNGPIELGQSPDGSTTYTHDNLIDHNLLYDLGQGVTSDMGCVHVASSNNTGNEIVNNVCHDVTHDPAGYGGNGIYLDSNSQNLEVKNNLVYRVSDTGFFVNTNTLANVIENNIFAFAGQGMMRRGPVSPGGSFTATHNIFLYDIAAIQRIPGDWACEGNCTGAFDLDSNIYWNAKGASAIFVTTMSGNSNRVAGQYGLAQWASEFGEDVHSANENPGFTNPTYPSDNFTFQNGSPAQAMGFEAFPTTDVGPIAPASKLAIVPAAFPRQLLNPITGF